VALLYRLRNAINYGHYKLRTRAIHRTSPIPCDPNAECELHTMLSARDLPLYLVAVKSLLRFNPELAVVVHSDGSLDKAAFETISHHVPGSHLINSDQADQRARRILGEGSFLWGMRQFYVSFRRLVDTALWSQTNKRIIMDADVLVLSPPVEVVDWIRRGDRPFLMGQPPVAKPANRVGLAETSQRTPKRIQTIFKERLPEIASALDCPALFLDGGTGGFYGTLDELTLEKVERIVKVCIELGIPIRKWGGEQCVIIFLLSVQGAYRLDPEVYVNFSPSLQHTIDKCSIVHFYGTARFHLNVYARLSATIVGELARDIRCPSPSPIISWRMF
jgi:hypothetical protein